jgi:hypothetical protein
MNYLRVSEFDQLKEESSMRRAFIVLALALLMSSPQLSRDVAWAQPTDPTFTRSIEMRRGRPDGFTLFYPERWQEEVDADPTSVLLLRTPQAAERSPDTAQLAPARMLVTVEPQGTHEQAVARLREIASEYVAQISYREIGGWPAMERIFLTPLERVGQEDRRAGKRPVVLRLTTVIAAGSSLIRFETRIFTPETEVSARAGGGAAAEARRIGRAVLLDVPGNPAETEVQVERLRARPRLEGVTPAPQLEPGGDLAERTLESEAEQVSEVGFVRNVQNFSEIETAVSTNGRNIVVATNNRRYSTSTDGGQTFTQALINTPANEPGEEAADDVAYNANGDPSLGVGASGAFYFGFIGFPDGTGHATLPGNGTAGCTTSITASTDGGLDYAHRGHATLCPLNDPDAGGPLTTCFPDQEHIAADRFNPGATGDQVYSAWRNFTPAMGSPTCTNIGTGGVQSMLTCSTDGGQTWPLTRNLGGDFPRVTVGADGFVYVVTEAGGAITLAKYSSCQNGLNLQFTQQVVAGVTAIPCPVAGLDRCNNGNDLRSHTVAVDDLNPSHVFVAWAQNTTGTNDDVRIADSTNGGDDFNTPVTLNVGFAARRYMPWACSVGGTAYVGWFDRRNSTVFDNSLTDYFVGRATRSGASFTAGPELRVTPTSDSNCGAGWPCAPRATADSESCTVQPQLAGVCADNNAMTADSNQACDYTTGPACPMGETCQIGGGCPKYGDYNGIACGAGRLYATWASATPPGGPQSTNIDSFLLQDVVCCVPEIRANPLVFGDVCDSGAVTATLDVCNTGVEDLEVTGITSDDTNFVVVPPVPGFPVVISKDFCFPFQVRFTPTATGADDAILTIANNDPVNPALQVAATADVGTPDLNTTIANAGAFGDVCTDEFKDLTLSLLNQGTCDLTITSITSSDPQFVLPANLDLPLVLSHDADFAIPIRFDPTTCGETESANITIASDSPGETSTVIPVSGFVPCPDINVAIANNGNFGDVCKGGHADLDLTLFNQGKCDLTITSITIVGDTMNVFELPATTQFPLVLSPDADFNLPVRFAPDMCFDVPKNAVVRIESDAPGEGTIDIPISGTSPCPNLIIDPDPVTGVHAFPATVVDSTDTLGCFSERDVVLRNNGMCPLTIDSITAAGVSGDPLDYRVTAPSIFPVVLPGGEETLNVRVRFNPKADTDPLAPSEVTGLLTVVSDDPDFPHEADLCGESVRQSGVRILVTNTSSGDPVPVDNVDVITIASKGKNTPSPVNLRFTDVPVQTVDICENEIQYHVDQETLASVATTGSNPKSSLTAAAKEGNLQASESFSLNQCQFREFQLQLSDSDSPVCLLKQKGESCSTAGECCSGKCTGSVGNKTCK